MRCAYLTIAMMLLGSGVASAQVLLTQPAKFPIKISRPGSYRLTENLDVKGGDAIDVLASNVTIDLNGFSIVGSSVKSSGIGINAVENGVRQSRQRFNPQYDRIRPGAGRQRRGQRRQR